MNLSHYTAEPLKFDPTRTWDQKMDNGKPLGFWVSVDEGDPDWPTWYQSENFATDHLEHRSIITLRDDANIVTLHTAAEIRQLGDTYPWTVIRGWVDWAHVAEQFDGILIPEYHWEARFNPFWYAGWDCASGCIWNLDAIASVTAAEPVRS